MDNDATGESGDGSSTALPYDRRPTDDSPRHTADLPATPTRQHNIPASAWVEAPPSLRQLGDDLPARPVAEYKRRIGPWLLWRAGPATRGHARYWAAHADAPDTAYTFRLYPDGAGDGVGPSGTRHTRFRSWKEDLRDSEVDAPRSPQQR
jgi:hypothetical protein